MPITMGCVRACCRAHTAVQWPDFFFAKGDVMVQRAEVIDDWMFTIINSGMRFSCSMM